MISLHGLVFRKTEGFWYNLRNFFYKHKTLSDISFLAIYTLEQLALFLLILIIPKYSSIFAGMFAIIFIATISFEKICMESRYRLLERNNINTIMKREDLVREYNQIMQDNERLRDVLESFLSKKTRRRAL